MLSSDILLIRPEERSELKRIFLILVFALLFSRTTKLEAAIIFDNYDYGLDPRVGISLASGH